MQYQQIPQASHSFPSPKLLNIVTFHISLLECPNCIGDAACPTRGKGREHLAVTAVAVDALCNCATLCTFQPRLERQDKRCCPVPLPHDFFRGKPVYNTRRKPIAVGWAELPLSRPPLWCLSLQMFRWTSGPSVFILPIVTHPTVSMTQKKRIHTPGPVAPSPTTYHLPPTTTWYNHDFARRHACHKRGNCSSSPVHADAERFWD